MTGPRIDRPAGADAHGTPIIPRALTYEEWQQAQGMSAKAMTAAPFPTQPPVFKPDAAGRMGALNDGIVGAAARDVTRTPADPNVRGVKQRGVEGVIGNIVNPAMEHPWMTAGVIGSTMIPVVGPWVARAMAGDMVANIALYGYQRHLDNIGQPPIDSERISGEAAAAQAIMLGLAPLAHVAKSAPANPSMELPVKIPRAAESLPLRSAERAARPPDDVADMELPVGTNKFIADLEAGAATARIPTDATHPEGFQGSKTATAPARQPKHPSGFSVDNPFAPENVKVKPIETTSPADQLQNAADAANDPMRPRRRPAIQMPEGAEILGSVAQRNGLDVESNPFPPATPLNEAWKTGHEAAAAQSADPATAGTPDAAAQPLEPLPAYPDGFSMGGTDNRIPDVPPLPGLKGNRPIGKVRGTDGPSVPPIEPPADESGAGAPVTAPVAAAAAPAQAAAPVDGTGPLQTRGLSAGVEERAIANRLTDSLGELPQYRQMSMVDQATKASDLLTTDAARARRIALGEEAAPTGLLPESVFVAVENKAIADGDVATLRDLATGKLPGQATEMGQRIRTLGERDPESPVAAIQGVIDARSKGVKDVSAATKMEVAAIEEHIGKVGISTPTWKAFVDSLRC